jgi:hypothetical protein
LAPLSSRLLIGPSIIHASLTFAVPAALCSWEAGELRGSPNTVLRSPVASCHYLVDHASRAIFVRTTKIGGTTLASSLGVANHPIACRCQAVSVLLNGCGWR